MNTLSAIIFEEYNEARQLFQDGFSGALCVLTQSECFGIPQIMETNQITQDIVPNQCFGV